MLPSSNIKQNLDGAVEQGGVLLLQFLVGIVQDLKTFRRCVKKQD